MIKIICPTCESDDIYECGEEVEVSRFSCGNCTCEFDLNISMSDWEFDTN